MATLTVRITERLAEQDHSQRAIVSGLLAHVAQKVGDHITIDGDIVYDGRKVGSWNYVSAK